MKERKALALAASTIFPVAFVLIALRSIIEGDLRELFVSWYSAIIVGAIAFPVAFAIIWLLHQFLHKYLYHSIWSMLVVIMLSYELTFWSVIYPFWENSFSKGFSATLVGTYSVATAVTLYYRSQQR